MNTSTITTPTAELYYVLSVRTCREDHPYIPVFRPNSKGYAYPLSWAGKFTRDEVLESKGFFNNGDDTVAVRCDILDKLGQPPAPGWVDRDAGPVVANTKNNWDALVAGIIARPAAMIRVQIHARKRRASFALPPELI